MRAYQNYDHGLAQDLTMSSSFNPEAANPSVALHTEDLSVSRRENIGDAVRVSTVTRERERLVDETLTHERVEIERVPIGRLVDAVPPVREEGDTTIMPVVEETVVIERRLILKEEVHIRRVRTSEQHRETVMLQEQDAVITRTEGDSRRSEMTGDPSGQA
jgi:stress response protein YsnF